MVFFDNLGKGLGNLAKAGYEKMQEMRAEIDEEKCKMSYLSVDKVKREANRGKTTHRMAALEILKEEYGIVPKRKDD